jgi:hypothetical protein
MSNGNDPRKPPPPPPPPGTGPKPGRPPTETPAGGNDIPPQTQVRRAAAVGDPIGCAAGASIGSSLHLR